jgi:hypothetical protein
VRIIREGLLEPGRQPREGGIDVGDVCRIRHGLECITSRESTGLDDRPTGSGVHRFLDRPDHPVLFLRMDSAAISDETVQRPPVGNTSLGESLREHK